MMRCGAGMRARGGRSVDSTTGTATWRQWLNNTLSGGTVEREKLLAIVVYEYYQRYHYLQTRQGTHRTVAVRNPQHRDKKPRRGGAQAYVGGRAGPYLQQSH